MPTRSQFYPRDLNIRRYGKLDNRDLTGFTKVVKAIQKLFRGGKIDVYIVPNGIITVKDKKTITISLYEKGVMPGGIEARSNNAT